MDPLEIWASPEPTIARLDQSDWRDQSRETGHDARESDIDRLAELGVAGTRYPVLWERIAPLQPARRDYAWADRRLARLRAAGIEVVPTLLHHGSGPAYTSLIDPHFPNLFADFAESTARRYPWIKRWTPINEPLTTARFSTLYGAWFPNGSNNHVWFGRAVLGEARAILLAMQRIEAVIPGAELVLTEDLQGFTAGDDAIRAYADFKRERSFLSAELILGRVVRGHSLWSYLVETCRVSERELGEIAGLARPIALMGYNYYPNSERYLLSGGGTAGHRNDALVDIEPARLDPKPLLRAAAARLRVPLGLTEVHVIGNEHERARWMLHRYDDAQTLRREGVDVRAFGAWAAFGMIDWTSLLRRREDQREDGVFTCGRPGVEPQWTRVADVVAGLARGEKPAMPEEAGWWERDRDQVA